MTTITYEYRSDDLNLRLTIEATGHYVPGERDTADTPGCGAEVRDVRFRVTAFNRPGKPRMRLFAGDAAFAKALAEYYDLIYQFRDEEQESVCKLFAEREHYAEME